MVNLMKASWLYHDGFTGASSSLNGSKLPPSLLQFKYSLSRHFRCLQPSVQILDTHPHASWGWGTHHGLGHKKLQDSIFIETLLAIWFRFKLITNPPPIIDWYKLNWSIYLTHKDNSSWNLFRCHAKNRYSQFSVNDLTLFGPGLPLVSQGAFGELYRLMIDV